MDDSPEARRARAERRRQTWTVECHALGSEPPAALLPPEVALRALWELSVDAWAMTGQPYPTDSRAEMPGRLLRPDAPE